MLSWMLISLMLGVAYGKLVNSSMVRMWLDPWVLGNRSIKNFYTDCEEDVQDLKVSYIIKPDGKWDSKLNFSLVHPWIVDEILKIRLGSMQHRDKWIWLEDRRGVFSVRSAYKFFTNMQRESMGESSSMPKYNFLKKKLWHLKILPKIKIFAWRACNDSLPCFKKLYSKKIVDNMKCKLCNQPMEDLSHALLFCNSICHWQMIYLPILDPLKYTNQNFLAVLEFILKHGNEEEGACFFTIAWSFWRRRNKLIYDGIHTQPQEAIEMALSLKTAYQDSFHVNQVERLDG